MKKFQAALWTEFLKARRSRVPLVAALGFCLVPAVIGLFMVILKDPEAARSMGLISVKAQLVAGEASWAALFDMLAQAVAIGGFGVYGVITTWVFGREFSDRTVKDLLALPTSRSTIIWAKFVVVLVWSSALTVLVVGLSLLVGYLVKIPGWSVTLLQTSLVTTLGAALLTLGLLPFVALFASTGRGYLVPVGWIFLTVALAQVVAFTGWGDYFPWSIPALFTGAAGPRAGLMGAHSYWIIALTCVFGIGATLWWWNNADQAK